MGTSSYKNAKGRASVRVASKDSGSVSDSGVDVSEEPAAAVKA